MSLRAQIETVIKPVLLTKFAEVFVSVKVIRHILGEPSQTTNTIRLGPFPDWFTIYELKLALWNSLNNDPIFAPSLVFLGIPVETEYKPIDVVWKGFQDAVSISLINPFELISGPPDSRFVDSSGGQKAVGKDNRIRMTLNDVFQLSEGGAIPELHAFLYADIIDRIPGARPLGERDMYGRILPYFPFLDLTRLPSSGELKPLVTAALTSQAKQSELSLMQLSTLETLLSTVTLPSLEGIKLLRWFWYKTPTSWEGVAVLFFGLKATHDRPFLRFFPASNQPLTKIKVKGILAIPDLPDPNLLLSWKGDKNPESGKESLYMKIRVQETDGADETPIFSTMRVFEDGTADLVIQPPKKTRLLDPGSDLQDAPEVLDRSFSDTPFNGLVPRLAQAAVVFKLRIKREDTRVTKTNLQNRLKLFSSIFQEIPPLPDEQPLAMLRFKGVSNFTNESRVFAFLTQIAEHAMISGERNEVAWVSRVADEFQIGLEEAKKQVSAWMLQRGEYALAVSDTKDYILNKNPGVDIAIYEQHPSYTFHIYSDQDSKTYSSIVNLLGILVSSPQSAFTKAAATSQVQLVQQVQTQTQAKPVQQAQLQTQLQQGPLEEPENLGEAAFDDDDLPEFMKGQLVGGGAGTGTGSGDDDEEAEADEEVKFNEDDVPEFMKGQLLGAKAEAGTGDEEEAEAEGEEEVQFNEDDELPEFMRGRVAEATTSAATSAAAPQVAPKVAIPPTVAAPVTEEDKQAAKAFEKPKDISTMQIGKYYIERLKLADPDLFVYKTANTSERGYVSSCAANESRQPIVLDKDEYAEMREIYKDDTDLEFVIYPDDSGSTHFKKKQPTSAENLAGTLDGEGFPSQQHKEVITLMKYGSKARRINYYFCPRLFCIRDRLMIRMKDYLSDVNRFSTSSSSSTAKAKNSCPFCGGTMLSKDDIKDKKRDPNKTILERKTRPGSDSERSIYIGFLDKKTPSGLSLPCCYSSTEKKFNPDDPEFTRLGLRTRAAAAAPTSAIQEIVALQTGQEAEAQPIADAMQGKKTIKLGKQVKVNPITVVPTLAPSAPTRLEEATGQPTFNYQYYRIIQAVSVKSIVDSSRIPLRIVETKEVDDPKAGPQIGFLPEALDQYFKQDSTSDKFAERIEIVSKLKPSAQGFMRVAIDNSKKEQSLLSAIAAYYNMPNADFLIEKAFEPLEIRFPPKKFMQINGGNLVHEFFNKCDKKHTNDIRMWASKYLNISELTSKNIPAIERLMNSYECFLNFMRDPSQRKNLRIFLDMFSEPNLFPPRGALFIVLELTVEEISIRTGDKVEFRTEVKLDKVRCPQYPLNIGQQKADIAFVAHYNRITRDRYTHVKTYRDIGWDALFHVDGTQGLPESRHRPMLTFQRSQEATWPKIVQERVAEFFSSCVRINRGPFTSEFGVDPYSLIGAQEIIPALRNQPNGMIRDAYNHLVAVAYKIPGQSGTTKGIAAIPVSDDGTFMYERNIYLDWNDFDPPPINRLIHYYLNNVLPIFPQYTGYTPIGQVKESGIDKIIGMRLKNGLVIPATNPDESNIIDMTEEEYPTEEIDDLEYITNNLIAYDNELRKKAFADADEGRAEGEPPIEAPNNSDYLKLNMESSQDEIEDVYQHLRLTFSTWLDTGAGSQKRERLTDILKSREKTLNDKRRELDILLYNDIHRWLEPSDSDEKSDIGFLRIDCQIQGRETCTGRCKWVPKDSDNESCGPCKIHSPKSDGITMNVPRMLYLRLVDELIRYASKREEIFNRQVPRLTIRREKQHQGDQLIIAEGSTDWNTWWEMLRSEWFSPEKETSKFFDEQYEPRPRGLPSTDTRTLPQSLIDALGPADPKVKELVWNPSQGKPFSFLKPILRFHPIVSKDEPVLIKDELDLIKEMGNVQILYMPTGTMRSSTRAKQPGAIDALIIATVDGVVGWISPLNSYGIKIPLSALPESLNSFRTV